MSLPNDSLDLDLVLLDFHAAYAEDPLDALAMLQCLLLNEDLIAARQEYLEGLASREGMSAPARGNFTREIDLSCFDKAQEEVELTLVAESDPERPGLLVPFVEITPAPWKDGLAVELHFTTPEGSLARSFRVPKPDSHRLATASEPGELLP